MASYQQVRTNLLLMDCSCSSQNKWPPHMDQSALRPPVVKVTRVSKVLSWDHWEFLANVSLLYRRQATCMIVSTNGCGRPVTSQTGREPVWVGAGPVASARANEKWARRFTLSLSLYLQLHFWSAKKSTCVSIGQQSNTADFSKTR